MANPKLYTSGLKLSGFLYFLFYLFIYFFLELTAKFKMINHHQLDYKYFNIMMRNNLSNLAPFSYETKLMV